MQQVTLTQNVECMYLCCVVAGFGFGRPKPVFPAPSGKNWEKGLFPGIYREKLVLPGKNWDKQFWSDWSSWFFRQILKIFRFILKSLLISFWSIVMILKGLWPRCEVFDKGVKAWLQTGADEEICLNEVQAKLPILRSLRLFFTPFFFDMKTFVLWCL